MQAQLHNATAYNADTEALKGQTLAVGSAKATVIQFATAGGYDGAVTVEISPDNGTTWFTLQAESLAALGTYVSSITSFTPAYRVIVPSQVQLRCRMSGGTAGTLTVTAVPSTFALLAGRSGVSAPAKPSTPTASVISTSRIDLTWTDVATTETEYRVYRSTDNVTFSLIDTIAANSTSHSDTTISGGTTYWYKVGSYNAGGETLSDASNAANTLTLSLVSYWQLEEVSGTRVDSFGDNDLTPTNSPVNATGIVGNAVSLVRSSSQQLSVATNATLETGNIDHTIACWIYPVSAATPMGIVCKANVDAAANADGYEWMLYVVGSNIRFFVARGGGGSGTNSSSVTSDVSFTLNAWNYVEGFYDATNALVGVVVNGTVKTAASTTVPGTSTGAVRIGSIASGGSYFDGRVDEGAFWKRLLTTNERAAQYNGGAGRAPSFLAG